MNEDGPKEDITPRSHHQPESRAKQDLMKLMGELGRNGERGMGNAGASLSWAARCDAGVVPTGSHRPRSVQQVQRPRASFLDGNMVYGHGSA